MMWSECFIFISRLSPMVYGRNWIILIFQEMKLKQREGKIANSVSLVELKLIVDGSTLTMVREQDTRTHDRSCQWKDAGLPPCSPFRTSTSVSVSSHLDFWRQSCPRPSLSQVAPPNLCTESPPCLSSSWQVWPWELALTGNAAHKDIVLSGT